MQCRHAQILILRSWVPNNVALLASESAQQLSFHKILTFFPGPHERKISQHFDEVR